MTTHVKVLGGIYIALSSIGLLAALFLSLAVGTASGIVGAAADAHDAAIALPIIGIAGTALVVFSAFTVSGSCSTRTRNRSFLESRPRRFRTASCSLGGRCRSHPSW